MEYRTVKELCSIVADCPHSTPVWTTEGKIVIRNNNIKNGRIDFSHPSYTDQEHFEQRIRRVAPISGDIVITREAPIGDVGMIPEGVTCCLGQRMVLLRANNEICDNYYLLYALQSRYVQHQIKWSEGTGTTVSNMRIPHLEQLKIPYPPLEAQRKIGSILRAIEEKAELNRKINNNLINQIECLCSEWLEHDEAPEGWSNFSLSDIAEFVGGYSYKSSELVESNIAMATIKNFDRNGGFKLDGYKELQPSPKIKPSQYAELFDILVAHTDLTQNAEVVGNTELIMSKSIYDKIVFSMDLVKVIPTAKGMSKFLLAAILQAKRFKAHCLGYVNGTTVLHLSKKALPEFPLMLPNDLSTLKPLDEAITVLYKTISTNIAENMNLEALRDSILPKLMSGELDVSDVEI